MSTMLEETRAAYDAAAEPYNQAVEKRDAAAKAVEGAPKDISTDDFDALNRAFEDAQKDVEERKADLDAQQDKLDLYKRVEEARKNTPPVETHGDTRDTADGEIDQRTMFPDFRPYNFETRAAMAVRSTREPLTYERYNGQSFFVDLLDARTGDLTAIKRLQSHAREMFVEKRAINETAGTGGEFVPPVWLMEDWIKTARAGRPTANIVQRLPLIEKTNSINMPSYAGPSTATAAQADGGAVQSTDPTTSSVQVPVKTIAGQVDLARQLLDRSVPGMDVVIFDDLMRSYATKLDVEVTNGSGSGAHATGILNTSSILSVTYTSGSPTQVGLFPYFGQAISQISENRFLPPDAFVMHPRRWYWLATGLDSQNRPLIVPSDSGQSVNTFAGYDGTYAENVVGRILGVPVVLDASLPTTLGSGTNQDIIICFRTADSWLWEDAAPRAKVYEEVLSGNLQIRCQIYGYFAFSAARYPSSICTIGGTGLTAPSGF